MKYLPCAGRKMEQKEQKQDSANRTICRCGGITAADIQKNARTITGRRTSLEDPAHLYFNDLMDKTGIATHCGFCYPEALRIFRKACAEKTNQKRKQLSLPL